MAALRAAGDALVEPSAASLIALARAAHGFSLRRGMIRARRQDAFRSVFKGRGMEYDESRPYQSGDDNRHIDWRVTARTGEMHTKIFREERERPVFVCVDFRAPMGFATRGRFKSAQAAELAALLAWSAAHDGDRVGGLVFDDRAHHEIKPDRGRRGPLRLINRLARRASEPGPSRGLDAALSGLSRIVRSGSLVLVVSDFRGLDEHAAGRIEQLARRNEVALVFVFDALEAAAPPPGLYCVGDGQRELVFDSADKRFVRDYEARFAKRQGRLLALAKRARAGVIRCRTDENPAAVLGRHFAERV